MTEPPRTLSANTTLAGLRREAKRWKHQIDQGEPSALARFRALMGQERPGLRQVQQALAREHGHPGWAQLKQELEDRTRDWAQTVELFLEKGVNRYGGDPRTGKWGEYEVDGLQRGALAARLLARNAQLARHDIHTAVLAHDLESVRAQLAKNPAAAKLESEFDGWTPLARLAYARLPLPAGHASPLEIASVLLAAGADAQAPFTLGLAGFSILTGVIGGGEGGQSPHPDALALARLLVVHGADPLDGQALYNTSLGADDLTWLERLWAWSAERGETARWRGTVPQLNGPVLDYLLGNAVPRHPRRVAWLLTHGADANAANSYSKRPVLKDALIAGAQEVADLLRAHGARPVELSGREALLAAVARREEEEVRERAGRNPELLAAPGPLFAAVARGESATAALLIDLGASPDLADRHNMRALHLAADEGQLACAQLLIARGAQIDPVETRYNSTPLGHANFNRKPELVALLAPLSRDIRGLCFAAAIGRLTELLQGDPALANRPSRGEPPLFALPEDEAKAVEVAELLLSLGADPAGRNAEGLTPAQAARRRGLDEVVDLLES